MRIAIAVYIILINIIAFAAYGLDKRKAIRGQWRTPERTLMLLAALGGSVGAYAGMRAFHHKTRHNKFRYGVPAIFVLQAALCVAAYLVWR